MAISHADHNHPNTPAARAACRKAMAGGGGNPRVARIESDGKPAKVTVVPRRKGDGGVVKGMQATAPKAAVARLKLPGRLIKSVGDLGDVPAILATEIRRAWDLGWEVVVGHPFNHEERRVVIFGPSAEIALVWSSDGRTGCFTRKNGSSITRRMADFDSGFKLAG